MKIRRWWIHTISHLIRFKIIQEGEVPNGVYLFISNHRSFMDPVAALHFVNAYPLSKAEVIKYPLIGLGARLTGVLFVERNNADSRKGAKTAIIQTFKSGFSTLIYPEGTTKASPVTDQFKKGSFVIAAEMKIPVVPIAIEYKDENDHWIKRGLWDQYLYQFGKVSCTCKIMVGPPMADTNPDRLMERTKTWIDYKLVEARKDFDELTGNRTRN